ncbi:DBH-like monooxygenase protein 1, partial [Kappamyces sp. JEL0680]
MYLGCIAVGIFASFGLAAAPSWVPFDATKYSGHQTLSPTVELFWQLSNSSIEIGIASNNGAGWLGIGTSDAGGMKGANVWVGRKGSNGSFVLEERFTTDYVSPELTAVQSATLLESFQTDKVTAFRFSRPLVGCDAQHATLTDKNPLWFIYAVGKSNSFGQHAPDSRGQAFIDLTGNYFKGLTAPAPTGDYSTLSLLSPRYELAANESTIYAYT